MFVPVIRPETESELSVILGMLDAYKIPYFVRNSDFGRIAAGVSIPSFNERVVLVPSEAADDARSLLADFLRPDPHAPTLAPPTIGEKIRVALEGLIFGWFVRGNRRAARKRPGHT
jgi:hypothetical protein